MRLPFMRDAAMPQRITFDEGALQAQLSIAIHTILPRGAQRETARGGEVRARDLVGIDNPLALAKVRLDMERELRRLVEETNTPMRRAGSIPEYIRILMGEGILPPQLRGPLDEVARVANLAVH